MNLEEAKTELDTILAKLQTIMPKGRISALVVTKLQEGILWYKELLNEPETEEVWKNEKSENNNG